MPKFHGIKIEATGHNEGGRAAFCQFGGRLLEALTAASDEHHRISFAGECEGGLLSHATSGAGDHSYFLHATVSPYDSIYGL